MADFAVDWVDAFAEQPFGGNGCAVVHNAAHLDDETCKAFVRETSLVECTFLAASETADLRVRYFLAGGEIPFAGHPTIATVASVVHRSVTEKSELTLETGAGIVPISVNRDDRGISVTMTQIAPSFGPLLPAEMVANAVGLSADDIIAPPQFASTGLPFCITLLRDRETLMRAKLNVEALHEMTRATAPHGDNMVGPYLVTLEGATDQGDTFARLLLQPPCPPEDPFTGSATGATAAWLWHHGHIDTPNYAAEQGHGLGRPGTAQVEVLGPRDAIAGVRVSGRAHVLMSGTLHL